MAYPLRSNIPKVNPSNFGPVDTGPGAGLMAQALKRKRYAGDTEYDPGPPGIMKEVPGIKEERAISKKEALKAQKRKNNKEKQAEKLGLLEALMQKDSFETQGKPIDFSEALTNLEGGNLKRTGRGSGLVEEELMSDTSPKLMEESTIRGDDPVTKLTEDIVQTSSQAAQADIDAGLEQEDTRFAEAQRRRNIMRGTGSEGTVAGSEDAAKFGQGAELEVKNLQRKAPHLFEEGTIKADDPPERIEALTLQVEAAAGNKKAQKEQEQLYKQFKDPQVRAQVKEESGNYYIDPISGRPINLESLRKSPKRQRDMKMIAMFPEHMRPHALANMGYLDREDIPVDYKHMLKRDQLTFDMSKWSAEHSEKNRQFNATLDFKQKAQRDLEKRLGRKLTLEEKTQNDLNADRDYKQLWDNINGLIKEGNSPAATLLAKGAGLKLDFKANTAIQTEILEKMADAKSAGISHPQGKEGTKAYFKFASDVHQKLITPRGDNISGDTYFDKALKAAGVPTFRESGFKGPEHVYNAQYYDVAYATMMLRSPHSAFHKAVTDNNIAINLGGGTGDTTGGDKYPIKKTSDNNPATTGSNTPELDTGFDPMKKLDATEVLGVGGYSTLGDAPSSQTKSIDSIVKLGSREVSNDDYKKMAQGEFTVGGFMSGKGPLSSYSRQPDWVKNKAWSNKTEMLEFFQKNPSELKSLPKSKAREIIGLINKRIDDQSKMRSRSR